MTSIRIETVARGCVPKRWRTVVVGDAAFPCGPRGPPMPRPTTYSYPDDGPGGVGGLSKGALLFGSLPALPLV